ncbi:hypothetical protein PYW08_016715 [Mythimna loreyi]|uniref:Uncharacterized protein n=1 Tax=Mythimna loreyi TaxID=667449 RepID=A0ACC2QZX8_9NEOP|nr:hypothetical protein PYW08_016715 [Mythimna loreyi]
MAGTHLAFTLLILAGLEDIQANLNPHAGMMNARPHLDPKRRSEIVDETFLEQKDILLEMLETKLKEVRDKRNKKTLNDGNVANSTLDLAHHDYKEMENIDVKVKTNGISAIGDSNVELKYGNGKRLVQMDAQGISNIGKAYVELSVGETGFFIPGLRALFTDHNHLNSTKNVFTEVQATFKTDKSKRSGIDEEINNSTTKPITASNNATVIHKTHVMTLEHATPVRNATVQIWNTHASSGTEVIPLHTENSTVTVTVTVPSNNTSNNTNV